MHRRLDFILHRKCKLGRHDLLLVGVSGGPDSLCLLHALHYLGYRLIVAHLDHTLRRESKEDASFVFHVASEFGVPFVQETCDVALFAHQHSLSLEEAARQIRYSFLFEQAAKMNAKAVVVGHTADDQVETLLMHLLRGAGLSGLRGMLYYQLPNAWSQNIPLVRPLLGFFREQILDYCQQHNLKPVEDISNQDISILRNRVRHELISILKTYNPLVKQALLRTTWLLQDEEQLLNMITSVAWKNCLRQVGVGFVGFDVDTLRKQLPAIKRRLIRMAVAQIRGGFHDIDYQVVEQALDFVDEPPATATQNLALGLRLYLESDLLWLAAWEADLPNIGWPQLPGEWIMENEGRLEVPGELSFPGQSDTNPEWQIITRIIAYEEAITANAYQNLDPYQAFLNAAGLEPVFKIRGRKKGDRFCPLGLGGKAVRISDYMINHKMPQRARAAWPLICSGEEIVWIPGYSLAHQFQLTPSSQRVVHLRLQILNQ